MKTIPALSLLLAALSAFLAFVPLGFEVTVSLLFAAGVIGILLNDYAQAFYPVRPRLAIAAIAARRTERFRLAA